MYSLLGGKAPIINTDTWNIKHKLVFTNTHTQRKLNFLNFVTSKFSPVR